MWILAALTTAVCWGFSYVAAGQLLKTTDKFTYLFFACFVNLSIYGSLFLTHGKSLSTLWVSKGWLAVAIISSVLGNFLTYYAIELKDATRAAMVEITYPLWCAVITIVLIGNSDFTWKVWVGGGLVMSGILVLLLE